MTTNQWRSRFWEEARTRSKVLLRALPTKWLRRILFMRAHHSWLSFSNPISFNEKVNWRMVFDRRESLAWTCDKLSMKEEAAERSCDIRIPRTLWSGQDLGELKSFDFPHRWVLKPNHGSQQVLLGEGNPDIERLKFQTDSWLDTYIGAERGEWAYTFARPLYLLEEWIGDEEEPPVDYKFFAFDGVVRTIQVDTDRFGTHGVAFYSPDWELLQVSKTLHSGAPGIERPEHLTTMIAAAERIAADFDFMRVDLFDTPNGVFFGETTPYPGSGLSPFAPKSFDYLLGSYWQLPPLGSKASVQDKL
ncbi:Uncharacterised protein [Kocuria rosea]|nr:Uncharacterised protein [Kocuria rosea]